MIASHHPTQYQPQNWLNPSHPWGSGAVDPHEPKPIQVIHAEPAIPLAGECPVGFCPLGATCSQNSGQWQCGCGQNACAGGKKLLLTYFSFEKEKKIKLIFSARLTRKNEIEESNQILLEKLDFEIVHDFK